MEGTVERGVSHHYFSYMQEITIKLRHKELMFLHAEAKRLAETHEINLTTSEVVRTLILAHIERSKMCPAFKGADREWLYHWLADSR